MYRPTLLWLLCFAASASGATPSGDFVIRGALVFDGSRAIERATVVVADGKIASVREDSRAPAGLPAIDGSGKTLLPGLIDCHTHAFGSALRDALRFGVTTELDMFADYRFVQKVKKEQADDSADIRSAGTLITAPKGHGTEYSVPIPTIGAPAEAQAFVDARIAEGSDYIKIIYTVPLPMPTISRETLAAVVEAAHKRGKLAIVHINSREGARDAIGAGADGLAHVFDDQPPGSDFGKLIAGRHMFVIPTLSALARRENAAASVRLLKAASAPVLAGTDAPNTGGHGVSLHRELELLVGAGLTPVEALRAATSTPASIFGLKDRGVIAAGARADLVLVDGDPTSDIRATRNIVAVWKAGHALTLTKPAPAGALSGPISDFEDGTTRAAFGMGWRQTSDQVVGGKSDAKIEVIAAGANSSRYSLGVQGEIRPGFAFAFAGAAFYPAAEPMRPADLSAAKSISFWAKGDGQSCRMMVYTQTGGYIPGTQNFVPGPEWKRYTFPLSAFAGTDGHDVTAIMFAPGPEPRQFSFQIDDVRLEEGK